MTEAQCIAFPVLALAAFLLGVWFLVRYARTRRRPFLVAGLVLTAGLGVIFLLLVLGGVLATTIVYAPFPMDTGVVYAPASTMVAPTPAPVEPNIIYAPPSTLNP
jgi:hypothetical protein